jgi:hypothetical protein
MVAESIYRNMGEFMQTRKLRSCVFGIGILFCVLFLVGCEQKTINEIMADPSRYANKEVAVVGDVTRSVSILGKGAYEVEDGTGRLWVVSQSGVPRKGASVVVKGKIRDAYDLTSFKLPEPVSSGVVLIEISHKAH